MRRKLYGKGINDSPYRVVKQEFLNGKSRQTWMCPYYRRWKDMLRRCYSSSFHKTRPTYKDCKVCDEWLIFTNFKSWMEKQDWEGKHLDKDILGGKKLYSPETCCFISQEVNSFIEWSSDKRDLPVGVAWSEEKKRYIAYGSGLKGKTIYLGRYRDILSCHLSWIRYKIGMTDLLLRELSEKSSEYKGLLVYKEGLKKSLMERTIFIP